MPGHFTFIGNEWDVVTRQPEIILPGIEKVSVVYWSGAGQQLKAVTRTKEATSLEIHTDLLASPEAKLRLQKFRTVSKPYEWIRLDESPLIAELINNKKSDLFTEFQNTILLLRFKNDLDGKYDVLMIYFKKNLNQFGVTAAEKVLSVENKSIIGHILYHYFRNIFLANRHNHSILKSVRQNIQSINKENQKLREEISQVRLNLEDMIINLSIQHLRSLAEKDEREYHFSQEAIEKLKSYRGNVRYLPAIIEQSVTFTVNLLNYDDKGPVKLHAHTISFDDYQAGEERDHSMRTIESRESRTVLLLDRLEKAARVLKSKDMSLTSVNIGNTLTDPITAPAITDALKKHKTAILNLFKKYPQKWEVIRDEFRPIRNLFKEEPKNIVSEEIA